MKDYSEYNDNELMMLISENNEDAKDIIYAKYHNIIDIVFKKYYRAALALNIEPSDLFQEALVGFSDAINHYQEEEKASFPTFASICIERRLHTILRNAGSIKNKTIYDSYSLEYEYSNEDDDSITLKDVIVDNNVVDPLDNISDSEYQNELETKIKKTLSDSEYEVYQLLIDGYNYDEMAKKLDKDYKYVDNAIQRIRRKIKKII